MFGVYRMFYLLTYVKLRRKNTQELSVTTLYNWFLNQMPMTIYFSKKEGKKCCQVRLFPMGHSILGGCILDRIRGLTVTVQVERYW